MAPPSICSSSGSWRTRLRSVRLSDNGIPTKYGDLYFFINPRLETGHKRYAWVNRTIFVGQGRFSRSSSVKFRVYRVANP